MAKPATRTLAAGSGVWSDADRRVAENVRAFGVQGAHNILIGELQYAGELLGWLVAQMGVVEVDAGIASEARANLLTAAMDAFLPRLRVLEAARDRFALLAWEAGEWARPVS